MFLYLQRQGYIKPLRNEGLNLTPIEYNMHKLLLFKEKIKERLKKLSGLPAELQQWIDSNLHNE